LQVVKIDGSRLFNNFVQQILNGENIMIQLLIGGCVAVVSLLGIGVCVYDFYRASKSNPSQRKPELTSYNASLEAIGNATSGMTSHACPAAPALGEIAAPCETAATIASHTLQGLSHIIHH
jgi:hypothetical protein